MKFDAGADRDDRLPRTMLRTPSFREFSGWIDVELEKLVARWRHVASPSASAMRPAAGRIKRRRRRKPK